jgi:hypothetical protein
MEPQMLLGKGYWTHRRMVAQNARLGVRFEALASLLTGVLRTGLRNGEFPLLTLKMSNAADMYADKVKTILLLSHLEFFRRRLGTLQNFFRTELGHQWKRRKKVRRYGNSRVPPDSDAANRRFNQYAGHLPNPKALLFAPYVTREARKLMGY